MRKEWVWKLGVAILCLGTFAVAANGAALRPRPVQPSAVDFACPGFASAKAEDWINTNGKNVTFERGKVYLVHFWTYGCINCKRNLPAYARWHKQSAAQNLTIIGVHTPETDAEKKAANVREQVKKLGVEYPVLLDQSSEHWKKWNQQIWPTIYLVDKRGRVRYRWIGELEWQNAGGRGKDDPVH